jgi:hypothetical protein
VVLFAFSFSSCLRDFDSVLKSVTGPSTKEDSGKYSKLWANLEPPPWHYINIWWVFKETPSDFQRVDIDISIENDIPSEYNFYISPINTSIKL